jgi:predicted  nucleic acid-binding Zn-ribbon protein
VTTNASTPNVATALMRLATEVDSLTKSLVLTQEELARETARRQQFEQESVDLAAALEQARERAKIAERDVVRLTADLERATETAQVRAHELQTRLNDANEMNERLRRLVESKERQRVQLETDLADVMQNLRHAAAEAAWPTRTVDPQPDPTRFGW